MMTQMITQALTTLALAGMPVGGTSDAQFISGERALLNQVGAAPVTAAGSHYGAIDAARALLGRIAGPRGSTATGSDHPDAAPAPVGAEQALLGRGA